MLVMVRDYRNTLGSREGTIIKHEDIKIRCAETQVTPHGWRREGDSLRANFHNSLMINRTCEIAFAIKGFLFSIVSIVSMVRVGSVTYLVTIWSQEF
jgi:hypothetical protein